MKPERLSTFKNEGYICVGMSKQISGKHQTSFDCLFEYG